MLNENTKYTINVNSLGCSLHIKRTTPMCKIYCNSVIVHSRSTNPEQALRKSRREDLRLIARNGIITPKEE